MLKEIIIFSSGVVAGGAATYFFLKKKIEKSVNKKADEKIRIADEKVQSMQDYVDSVRARELSSEAGYSQNSGKEVVNNKATLKDKNGKINTVDYTSYYQNGGNIEVTNVTEDLINQYFAEREGPSEDDYEAHKKLEEERKALLNSKRMSDEVNSKKPPFPIRKDEYDDYDYQYLDKVTLYYFMDPDGVQTGVLATEDNEVVDAYEVVGDVMETTGFSRNDEDALYVRNLSRSTDYEIAKVYESFTEQTH